MKKETDYMNYDDFIMYIKENLADCYRDVMVSEVLDREMKTGALDGDNIKERRAEEENQYEKCEVIVQKVVKNNGILLDAVSIYQEGERISPNIYLKPFYDSYMMGKPLDFIMTEIIFQYSENYKFILSLNASILKGDFYLSEKSYIYEPAFSGLYQNKIIEAKNNYNVPINILSVTSTDKRITYKLLIDKIYPNEKISLINILFDPSKYFEFRKGYELNMSNILTYKELYLWKIEDKYFDSLEITDQTSIKANLSIKTNVDTEYINIKGLLIKPNLVKKEKINFGLNQIGKPAGIFIEGINPSDKILLIKLLLADEYYNNIHWNNMFNKNDKLLLSKNSDLIIFNCNFILKINSTNVIKYEQIIVPEKIDPVELRKGSFDKKELIRLLYKYGNDNVKNYFIKTKTASATA